MPDFKYHGDDGRYYAGALNRLVADGDVVTADANPDPHRFDEVAEAAPDEAPTAPAADNPPQEG